MFLFFCFVLNVIIFVFDAAAVAAWEASSVLPNDLDQFSPRKLIFTLSLIFRVRQTI
jgi:hypothetical protein